VLKRTYKNREERPAKRIRLVGPPHHTRSIHVKVHLNWTYNQQRHSSKALLILDSSTTGTVLSSSWVKEVQLPCIRRENPTPIADASGNHIRGSGNHDTKTVRMWIGEHVNDMRFELADMPDTKIDDYLPMP